VRSKIGGRNVTETLWWLVMFLSQDCLAHLQQYEKEMTSRLPGNASTFRATSCLVQPGKVVAEGNWTIAQKTCTRLGCTKIWSYSGKAFGLVQFDKECAVTGVDLSIVPENKLLAPLLKKAEQVVWEKAATVINENEKYKEVVCGESTASFRNY
jgi:hypothetical protein